MGLERLVLFILKEKRQGGQSVRLAIKPLTYLDQTIFVAVLSTENDGILSLLDKSPLFKGYRDYIESK